MMTLLSRVLNESVLLRLLLAPRKAIYRLAGRISPRLRRTADSSYFFFFIRHPAHIRLKDYGLLLLAFELSFGLGRFMMNTLTPARRNACFLLGLLAILAIGPLDRGQTSRGRKIFALKAPFGFIIAALGFGFLGSFIAPRVFNALILFLAIVCLSLHSPLFGLGATLSLLPLLPWWSTLSLILIENLVRLYKRSAERAHAEPLSGRAFFLFVWALLVATYGLLLRDPIGGLPLLLLLFAYNPATDARCRSMRIGLFLCAVLGGGSCVFHPEAIPKTVILSVTVFLGTLPWVDSRKG